MSRAAVAPGLFHRPRWWWFVIAAALAGLSVWLIAQRHYVTGGAATLAGASLLGLTSLGVANRYRAGRVAFIGITLTLAVTWSLSALIAGVYYIYTSGSGASHWVPVLLPTALNVGGFLALFRSVQTRAETSATLREVSELRVSVLSAPLVEAAVRVERSGVMDVTRGLTEMLRLAIGLRLLPAGIDRASVWVHDPEANDWFIAASTSGAVEDAQFRQPAVEVTAEGGVARGGLVANFAACAIPPRRGSDLHRGDVLLIRRELAGHAWYMANPGESRHSDGLIVLNLRIEGHVIGALCLTSARDCIPIEGPEARELVDILEVWAHTFSNVVHRLYQPSDVSSRATP
jgi:hypothetical protein